MDDSMRVRALRWRMCKRYMYARECNLSQTTATFGGCDEDRRGWWHDLLPRRGSIVFTCRRDAFGFSRFGHLIYQMLFGSSSLPYLPENV
jgi:hypothetical protein